MKIDKNIMELIPDDQRQFTGYLHTQMLKSLILKEKKIQNYVYKLLSVGLGIIDVTNILAISNKEVENELHTKRHNKGHDPANPLCNRQEQGY